MLTSKLLLVVVRKLKKRDKLKNVGTWECEVGQDWSSRCNVELDGISESAGNVSDCWTCVEQDFWNRL